RVVRHELVTRCGERSAGRSRHPHAYDVAAQTSTALGQGDVVGVSGHDHHMGQVRKAEHVFYRVHGQSDVGTVLGVGGGGKQLHQVDRAADQLPAVIGVDRV